MFLEWLTVNDKGHLQTEDCDLVEVAREYGTPLYVFNESQIRKKCREYTGSIEKNYPKSEVIYAGKSFLTRAMCQLIEEEGLSLDVVSGGELYTALSVDFPAAKIYFHGNNKTSAELDMAVKSGVGRIVVDSLSELPLLNKIAEDNNTNAAIYLRIKPGITAHTHSYIQTGQADSKFGLGIDDGDALRAVKEALALSNINLKGLHCHIGSQIFDVRDPFRFTAEKMVKFLNEIRSETGSELEELNLGGGLGIRYTSEDKPEKVETFVEVITAAVKEECERLSFPLPKLLMEPGRSITGEAGMTLYSVGTIKVLAGIRTYVSVDGGMMDNLRPALYDAVYEGVLANRAGEKADTVVTIAGKACESGDILIRDLKIPQPKRGDILAVFSTGAYHYSMYSAYNRNPRPAVVFVGDGKTKLVVERESYEDMIRLELDL